MVEGFLLVESTLSRIPCLELPERITRSRVITFESATLTSHKSSLEIQADITRSELSATRPIGVVSSDVWDERSSS